MVLKPAVGTNGVGVDTKIFGAEDFRKYGISSNQAGPFLLEEFVGGDDLRLQIIGGKIVAACIREPAFVKGDGESTLLELIEQRRKEVHVQNPANRLDIDEQTQALIKEQEVRLDSVIEKNIKVRLKEIANMGQGARAFDVTDKIDPMVKKWVEVISTELQAPYFALDLISGDISNIETYKALELNIRAEWMHHTFSEGRTHDLAKVVIDELFSPIE